MGLPQLFKMVALMRLNDTPSGNLFVERQEVNALPVTSPSSLTEHSHPAAFHEVWPLVVLFSVAGAHLWGAAKRSHWLHPALRPCFARHFGPGPRM